MIINMTGGGGGASLNYKVLGGTEPPSAPSENTIWVNTENTITDSVFSVPAPESPQEGMVWFGVGTSSSAPINVLKKGTVMVYPTTCMQYISGVWENKVAKTYQNGEWIDWFIYLYNKGDFCDAVTGGWQSVKKNIDDFTAGTQAPTVTENSDSVELALTGYGSGYYGTINKIDLTDKTELVWNASITNSHKTYLRVFTEDINKPAAQLLYENHIGDISETVHRLNISSLSGEFYVAIALMQGNYGNSRVTMRELYAK